MVLPERRGTQRTDVSGSAANPVSGPYHLLNIGHGGFALESLEPFADGEHAFEFAISEECHAVVHATPVHSLRLNRPGAPTTYVTGFACLRLADDSHVDELFDVIVQSAALIGVR